MSILEKIKAKFKKEEAQSKEALELVSDKQTMKFVMGESAKEWGNFYNKIYYGGYIFVDRSDEEYDVVAGPVYYRIRPSSKNEYTVQVYRKNYETEKLEKNELVINKKGKVLSNRNGVPIDIEEAKKVVSNVKILNENRKAAVERRNKEIEEEAKRRYWGGYI